MENNQTIKKIDMELLEESGKADYADGDIIVFDNIKEGYKKGIYQLDMIVTVFCAEGKIQMDINGNSYTAEKGDFIICPPNALVERTMVSPDLDCKFIGLSHKAIDRSLHVSKNVWNMILYVAKNPVVHLDEREQHLVRIYYSLIKHKTEEKKHPYYREVMHSLFQTMFYELCSIIHPHIVDDDTLEVGLRQGDLLFKRFLKLLAQSDGRERSVSRFAAELCVTPKYLSTVTKAASGKTALQWIHEHVTENISRQLRYSDKSIKEIADDLNFPNLSFFGKFVRTHLGMSPTEYRKQTDSNSL